MELVQTLYVSHALSGIDVEELRHILASSVRRNAADGLTGFLMHGHGLFLQVLEGEPQAVEATMQRIRSDPRHERLDLLQHQTVQRREFGRWTMGFKDLSREDLAREPFLPFAGVALTIGQMGLRPRYALALLRSVSEMR
jgi:hypothetical protein